MNDMLILLILLWCVFIYYSTRQHFQIIMAEIKKVRDLLKALDRPNFKEQKKHDKNIRNI